MNQNAEFAPIPDPWYEYPPATCRSMPVSLENQAHQQARYASTGTTTKAQTAGSRSRTIVPTQGFRTPAALRACTSQNRVSAANAGIQNEPSHLVAPATPRV